MTTNLNVADFEEVMPDADTHAAYAAETVELTPHEAYTLAIARNLIGRGEGLPANLAIIIVGMLEKVAVAG